MRNARDFIDEYRRKGYPDDRIRIIASMRPEPLRSEVLKTLDGDVAKESQPQTPQLSTKPVQLDTATGRAEMATKITGQVPAGKVVDTHAPSTDELELARKQVTALRKERDRVAAELTQTKADVERLRAETAKRDDERKRMSETVKKEHEQAVAAVRKAKSEIDKLHADSAATDELRKRLAEAEVARRELEKAGARHRELASAKADMETRLAHTEATLEQKNSEIAEKERVVAEIQSALAKEEAERQAAVARVSELESTVQGQTERIRELASASHELDEAHASLEELRSEAAQLKEKHDVNATKVVDLETDVERSRNEAAKLREQIDANDRALTDLKEELNNREAALAALREHFEREATDLKRRAEQEVWTIRSKLHRVRKLAGIGAAAAACLLLFAFIGYVKNASHVSRLLAERTATQEESVVRGDQTPAAEGPSSPVVARREQGPESPLGQEEMQFPPMDIKKSPQVPAPDTQVLPPEPPEPQFMIHTVRTGDSLWKISEKYFGTGRYFRQIAKLNGIDPDARLDIGMELKVPAEEPR